MKPVRIIEYPVNSSGIVHALHSDAVTALAEFERCVTFATVHAIVVRKGPVKRVGSVAFLLNSVR